MHLPTYAYVRRAARKNTLPARSVVDTKRCATALLARTCRGGGAGQCVQLGCLGPMLTLVFAMSLVDRPSS